MGYLNTVEPFSVERSKGSQSLVILTRRKETPQLCSREDPFQFTPPVKANGQPSLTLADEIFRDAANAISRIIQSDYQEPEFDPNDSIFDDPDEEEYD